MKATIQEQQHRKKKMKIWKKKVSEEEVKPQVIIHVKVYIQVEASSLKLPDDVIASLFLRCSLKSLSMLRLWFVSLDMDGSREELYTVTAPDTQLSVASMQLRSRDFGFGYLHSKKEYKVVHFFYIVPSREKRWYCRGDLQLPHLKCEVLGSN